MVKSFGGGNGTLLTNWTFFLSMANKGIFLILVIQVRNWIFIRRKIMGRLTCIVGDFSKIKRAWSFPVELIWTALHQLHEWETTTTVQPHHVHPGAGGVPAGGYWLELHRLWTWPSTLHRSHRAWGEDVALVSFRTLRHIFNWLRVCLMSQSR